MAENADVKQAEKAVVNVKQAEKAISYVVVNAFNDKMAEGSPLREVGYVLPSDTEQNRIEHLLSVGVITKK